MEDEVLVWCIPIRSVAKSGPALGVSIEPQPSHIFCLLKDVVHRLWCGPLSECEPLPLFGVAV